MWQLTILLNNEYNKHDQNLIKKLTTNFYVRTLKKKTEKKNIVTTRTYKRITNFLDAYWLINHYIEKHLVRIVLWYLVMLRQCHLYLGFIIRKSNAVMNKFCMHTRIYVWRTHITKVDNNNLSSFHLLSLHFYIIISFYKIKDKRLTQ